MRRIIESIERHERRLSALAILVAFIVDSVTLVRVDLYLTNLILVIYLITAGLGILLINIYEDGRARFLSEGAYRWIFIAVQFSFGGLFGRFLIYYSRGGSLYTSWPFLLILAVLLIGNEFAKKYYTRLTLQISFFFLALFSYLIFFIPVLIGQMGDDIFLLSGIASLLVVSLFVYLLDRFVPQRMANSSNIIFGSIGLIFFLINLFYFTNIIPPLPLSLREADIYHYLARTPDGYRVSGEKEPTLSFLMPNKIIHLPSGNSLSAFSAVFAPTDFETSIIHDWQYYNPRLERWEGRSRVTLPIVGGRDGGYRGYSVKNNIEPGYWRVNIETLSGQIVGRLKFKVEIVDSPPFLQEDLL